jgi:hypothetical protein
VFIQLCETDWTILHVPSDKITAHQFMRRFLSVEEIIARLSFITPVSRKRKFSPGNVVLNASIKS